MWLPAREPARALGMRSPATIVISAAIAAWCAAPRGAVAGDRDATARAPKPAAESSASARKSRGVSVQAGAASDAEDEPSGVRSVLRVERFVLRDGPEPPTTGDESDGERAHVRPLGAVEWRRMAHDDGMQIECEMLFARTGRDAPCQRVLHVEELREPRARLVWREIGAGSGRSVLAEWDADRLVLHTVDWGTSETVREEISTSRGAVMPLYLIEMLREGRVTSGPQLVFDPLARTLSELEIVTSYGDPGPPPCPAGPPALRGAQSPPRSRLVELRRSDGTLAGRYRFRGTELVGFQWQDGGPWAQRVGAREHTAALAQLSRASAKDAKDP
jgi:hypothetical protein